jgi:hypothetical protein
MALPNRKWVDNIEMNIQEIGREDANMIKQDRSRIHWEASVNNRLP